MPADVIMPALGMAQETGKILRWLKSEGDAVAKGEPLMEVETDKVTVEIEAPADGTLAGLRAAEGAEVPVGAVVAYVLGAGEVVPDTEPRVVREVEAVVAAPATNGQTSAEPRRRLASPKARRLAQERGIDIDALAGSGPRGAVVAADIEAAAAVPAPTLTAAPQPSNTVLLARGAPVHEEGRPREVGRVWRVMAERTQQSWQTVPHFYLRREVDATRLLSWREVARAHAPGVSPTDLLVKVAAEALRRHPNVNASWRDGAIAAGAAINVAIAVATDDGLVAPVIRDADRLELAQIAARRKQLVDAARAGKLTPDDVSGGTFTISNLGMFGVDEFDAIVVAPQAAILAVGRVAERAVVVDGHVVPRPTLRLTLSFDHRAVDGARGAEFLDTLASLIEEPAGLVR